MDGTNPALRRAGPADAETVAETYLRSFQAAYQFPLRHPDDAVRAWIRDVVIPARETWVAVDRSCSVVGMMVLDGGELDQLYLLPGWTGRGIGSRFVELAKQLRPQGLGLYTFQVNSGARRFYERHGFVLVDEHDGSRNEEHEPDARYVWRGAGKPPKVST